MNTKEHPLWNPTPGMKVAFPKPLSSRFEHCQILRVGPETHKVRLDWTGAIGPKTKTYVYYLSAVVDPADLAVIGGVPRWAIRESCVSLTHWRRVINKIQVLPADWEPPPPKPMGFKVTVTEPQLVMLAERVQALAGRIPEAEFAGLVEAVRPFTQELDGIGLSGSKVGVDKT